MSKELMENFSSEFESSYINKKRDKALREAVTFDLKYEISQKLQLTEEEQNVFELFLASYLLRKDEASVESAYLSRHPASKKAQELPGCGWLFFKIFQADKFRQELEKETADVLREQAFAFQTPRARLLRDTANLLSSVYATVLHQTPEVQQTKIAAVLNQQIRRFNSSLAE